MKTKVTRGVAVLVCVLASTGFVIQSPQALFNRAVNEFEQGRFVDSANTFDEVAKLVPDSAPELWQRGIALYYAGRFDDCRRQFESHRSVNPNDVENAAWHFLCVARRDGEDKARAALLPVGPDSRVPMREIYEMFRGKLKPADVLRAAGQKPVGLFYGHLYIGLYSEALGDAPTALAHIKEAAADKYNGAGYMHVVARVHLQSLKKK